MNLKNQKELAADFETTCGIPCRCIPIAVNISAPHLKLEFLGKSKNSMNQIDKSSDGFYDFRLIFRADGYNEAIIEEIAIPDEKLIDLFSESVFIETTDYSLIIDPENVATENIGWAYPEQLPGISEPDPSEKNDNSSRMIFTRIYQFKIKYSKK